MQIGSEMATLQGKSPKMDPKKRFFLKNPPGFLAFEKSSSKLTSNRPFWLKQIYRDIKFILRGLPERCDQGPKDCTGQYWAVGLDGLTYKMVLDDLIAA